MSIMANYIKDSAVSFKYSYFEALKNYYKKRLIYNKQIFLKNEKLNFDSKLLVKCHKRITKLLDEDNMKFAINEANE